MDCMRDDFHQGTILGGRFQTISPLNQGSFGMVFKARDLHTGKPVAVKCLTKNATEADDTTCPAAMAVDERSEELSIHSRIGFHPNIVNFITSFETDNHVYLVLEYCPNGDLYEAIRANKGPLETEHVRDFMRQLISAVDRMHSKGIYHRDIKPENIFLTSTGSIKIGDFGLATTETWSVEYGVGSDRYMAPEQFEASAANGYSPAAADIWAVGICLLNVLFGRNPFTTPTPSDPLYADYLRDRQSLFDVFPNMSQDTFSVLRHCLALDPVNRSLSALRDALETVISFTTDDESLDDFCTGDARLATHDREPLRTPSISSPQIDNGGAFPWAKALQATPQKPSRQLSVIPDNEEMFPGPTRNPAKVEPDAASFASALDSGIGMSYKSSNISSGAINMPISSSVPTVASRAMASIYGKDGDLFSKSWSDLWEEEEEEQLRSSFEASPEIERVSTVKPVEPELSRCSTPAIDIKPSSRGSSTPRMSAAEMSRSTSRANSPTSFRSRLSSHVKQLALSAPQGNTTPRRSGSSIMEKWSALGQLRRGTNGEVVPASPPKLKSGEKFTFSSLANAQKTKTRDRSGSWRKDSSPKIQPSPKSPFNNEQWNISKDWRSPKQPNYTTAPVATPSRRRPSPSKRRSSWRNYSDDSASDDIGDLEWVGGWNDLHL